MHSFLKLTVKILFVTLIYSNATAQNAFDLPIEFQKLAAAYPSFDIRFENNKIIFNDNSELIFDTGKNKSNKELLNNPDIKDIFTYAYKKGSIDLPIEKNFDPGRIRNEEFLMKMYGKTSVEVEKNLTQIIWCPKLLGQKLRVTRVNNVHVQLEKVSKELDEHPEWKEYLRSAGAFNRRFINGSNRLSVHSFGIAIDLNTKYSDYWQWSCKCTSENVDLTYKNRIPQGIVDIFEKHGFIWGGKWYHYDTMHFEYRPELLVELKIKR